MRNFYRSLRYLKPYKARLGVAVGCVLVIGTLWGGGLGMMLPGLKILIDPEGLHGWAWRSGAEDQLGAVLFRRQVPRQVRVDGQMLAFALDVVDVDPDGPVGRAGIRKGQWLIGTADEPLIPGGELARRLATSPAGRTVRLRAYDPASGAVRVRTVELAGLEAKADLLVAVAGEIPEPEDYAGRFPMLVWLLGIGVAVTVLRDFLRFVQDYLVQTSVQRAMMDIRCDNYNTALRLPTTFYASRGSSDTMSRFVQDTHELRMGQVALFGQTLVEPAKAAGSIAMALILSWELTLVAMIAGPPTILIIGVFGRIMKKSSRRALENWSRMLAVLEETLSGIRVVKAYTMEASERKRFHRVNRALLSEQDRMSRVDAATSPTIEAMGIVAGLVAAGAAGYFVLHHRMDPEVFMAWMGCLAAMFDPMRKLARVVNRFQAADAAAERIFQLNDSPREKRVPNAPTLPPHGRDIRFEETGFRYPGASFDALRDINVEIPAGQTVAVVGPNGSGKTTLVSLLPRLIDPTAGKVLIDGLDIANVSLRSLRSQIAVVTQDTVLFNATIAENISYGRRRPSDEDVRDAARKAFVDEFVRDLPDGYDTMVGEHGATLSGGQRQRITIARAILRDPRILIFDEAMSQVDAESERRIHEAMEAFIKGRTTLMIAHRFATVRTAERILVMEAGTIIDDGRHEELIDRCDLYRHLYRTQFADTTD